MYYFSSCCDFLHNYFGIVHKGLRNDYLTDVYVLEVFNMSKDKKAVLEEVIDEIKEEVKEEVKAEVKEEIKESVKEEVKEDVKEEIKEKTNETGSFLTAIGFDKKSDTFLLEDRINNISNDDTKVLAELLLSMKKDLEAEKKNAKRATFFSVCSTVLAFIVVIVTLGILVPKVLTVMDNANKVIVATTDVVEDAQEMITGSQSILDNLQKTTDEIAKADLTRMMDDVTELVDSTGITLAEAMNKINAIDIDTLNSSIKGLNDVVTPLSNVLNVRKRLF